LETVIAMQRPAGDPPALYALAAEALVQMVGLDVGMVLLARECSWELVANRLATGVRETRTSSTLLAQVRKEKRTFYRDLVPWKAQESLYNIEGVVVSPFFGLGDEVAGVLYGVRIRQAQAANQGIGPLEAQIVQLLASALGANLARVLGLRTRVQFEQFFSTQLAQELERDPSLLEGRDQEVTVLASDLRGFSPLAERLAPQQTCLLVQDLMERLSRRIVEEGGVIVDYAGDGILAMWNAPVLQEDHATRACRAALAMLSEMPGLNDRWQETIGARLVLGIGLNTGPARVGNTGCSRKLKYGPQGHTVNVASRVQDATKRVGLTLLITGSTKARLTENFATRRLCQARVAGIREPVMLYEVQEQPCPPEWLAHRDAYEAALGLYEARQWAAACQSLIPLLGRGAETGRLDTLSLRLLKQAGDCLGSPPDSFDPTFEVSTK
jgi:adenylate cyclase